MKLRILMTGADSDYAIERPYRKYLESQAVVEAFDFFPAQNIFLEYYRKSLAHKLLYRIGLSRILYKINHQLLETAGRFKPNIVVVFKGMEIFPSTLRILKARGIKLVNYNPDNPFIFSGRGSGNRNVTDSVRLFDLYLSYDQAVCRKLENDMNVKSGLLPFGFDISDELFVRCRGYSELIRPCFIGNADSQRLSFLNALAERGIRMDVFGSNWKRGKLHPDIDFKGYASNENLWINLRRYRVQLNLMRLHNPDSHNMRSFEIPAIGGIQLAPDTKDHRDFFVPGQEIYLFSDIEDCADKIRLLLAMPADEADLIREKARRRCLNSGYAYSDRAALFLSMLADLCSSDVK